MRLGQPYIGLDEWVGEEGLMGRLREKGRMPEATSSLQATLWGSSMTRSSRAGMGKRFAMLKSSQSSMASARRRRHSSNVSLVTYRLPLPPFLIYFM
jgi:hypothetical protein